MQILKDTKAQRPTCFKGSASLHRPCHCPPLTRCVRPRVQLTAHGFAVGAKNTLTLTGAKNAKKTTGSLAVRLLHRPEIQMYCVGTYRGSYIDSS